MVLEDGSTSTDDEFLLSEMTQFLFGETENQCMVRKHKVTELVEVFDEEDRKWYTMPLKNFSKVIWSTPASMKKKPNNTKTRKRLTPKEARDFLHLHMEIIGKRIKERRNTFDLSLEDLAQETGLTQEKLALIEDGKTILTSVIIDKLLNPLDMRESEFVAE